MGLDMYLRANREFTLYVKEHSTLNDVLRCENDGLLCYWRKVNQIHGWFVDNIQEGTDDQDEYEVFVEDLEALLGLVDEALDNPDEARGILPPMSGFFFGSSEIDEYYWYDLRQTKHALEEIIKCCKEYNKYIFMCYSCWW